MARRITLLIKDNEFEKTDKVPGPTKEEIRSIILYKSDVKDSDVVVDIGCGTGGISTEFSLRAKKVYSIDVKQEAVDTCKRNVSRLGNIDNVEFIVNDGVSALNNIDCFDIVIVGGSNGDLDEILSVVNDKLNVGGRVIVPSILVDTEVEAVNIFKDLGYSPSVVTINVSEGKVINRGIMMFAKNPINIVSVVKD